MEQSALSFASLLRQLRTQARLTQEELADAAGLSPRSVSDLERGINRTARKDTAQMLASALKLPDAVRPVFAAAARGRAPADDVLAALNGTITGDATAMPHAMPAEHGERGDAGASNVLWIEFAASSRFAGRDRELGVLLEAWSSACAGRRVLALVGGEPGIGKTALTAELARRVHANGGLVLYGRWNEEVLAPYQAFREALDEYARSCPAALPHQDLRERIADIACLFPELPMRTAPAPPQLLGAPEAERLRLFESLDIWIQRIAARHPVLLILDDLHWADRPSLMLLQHLMQARRSTPLLTVAMFRDVDIEGSELLVALPSLARDTDCRRISIGRLEREAVSVLLEATAGRALAERDGALAAELERESAGHPFFLLEMTRQLAELGAFDDEVAGQGVKPAEIPESVRDLVRWRLGRRSEKCAEVLAVASVVGERFDTNVLASITSLGDSAVVDLLEEAARAGLIAEIQGEPDWWQFSHSLTRRVIADGLSESRKTRLHERIGEILEQAGIVSPAELAHHFSAAANGRTAEKAIRFERLAARRARGQVGAEVAVRHYERAVGLLDRFKPHDRALRCELILELAGAHDDAGEYLARDDRFAEAADAARRLGRNDLFRQAALGYGGVLPAIVHLDPRAVTLLGEALELSPEDEIADRAHILARLVHWLHAERPYRERLGLSDQSVVLAREAGDGQTLATVLMHRCWGLDGPSDVGDALGVASEILDIGADLSQPKLTLEGLRIKLAAQFEKGEHQAALQTASAMTELAEKVRHPEFIRLATMWDVTLASLEGRFTDAEKLSEELDRRLRRIGHAQALLIQVAQTFSWRWLQGRASDYLPMFEALSASQTGVLAWRAVTAWCLAEAGAREQAADLLHRTTPGAAAAADQNYLWWAMVVGFADAAALLQDRAWAEVLYGLAVPYAGNNCTLGVASFFGAVDHWLGVLAAAAGRFADSVHHLEAALERHRAMRSRPLTALTEEAYGHVLSVRGEAGDSARARALTGSAMSAASELGLGAILNRARLRA